MRCVGRRCGGAAVRRCGGAAVRWLGAHVVIPSKSLASYPVFDLPVMAGSMKTSRTRQFISWRCGAADTQVYKHGLQVCTHGAQC
jgi:hypothetical protein